MFSLFFSELLDAFSDGPNFIIGEGDPVVEHVVVLKFRFDIDALFKDRIVESFISLSASKKNGQTYILSIKRCYGLLLSAAVFQDYDELFIISFSCDEDRDYYIGTDLNYCDQNFLFFKQFVTPYLDEDKGFLTFAYKS
ncbi:hypothetical protein [Elizabethkingia anophelis]|uniref:hypothetical protein n=1 Tax=Elizabethkingia anophelis TaxID=1117645 RepID=UPI001371EB3D|nr:hypothetical protein [Elizabethkingia anophelis]MYY27378.1 hypothetical protein [Elizabethkingia anophelis]